MTTTTHTISNADSENFDLAVAWVEARFGQDAVIYHIAQYRHHADTMVRVEGYDANGRHFTDERYPSEMVRLIAQLAK